MVHRLLPGSITCLRAAPASVLWASPGSGPCILSWTFFGSSALTSQSLTSRGTQGESHCGPEGPRVAQVLRLHFRMHLISRKPTLSQAVRRFPFFTSLASERLGNCFHPLPSSFCHLASPGLTGVQLRRKGCSFGRPDDRQTDGKCSCASRGKASG